jgi:Flp pilus assembly protein TadB
MGRGCFHTLVVLVCFLGLRSIRSRKIAKIFGCAIVRIFSTTFYTASVELTHSARPRAMTGICAKETAGVDLNRTLRIAIAQCRADVSLAATAADLAIVGRLPMRPARVRRDRARVGLLST